MLTLNTVLQNRYRIIRQLGQGGMGTVYEARDERLDTTVALKESHFTDERLGKQFEREARLLAKLRHPAMTRVIDHFTEGNGQFLVMDFIAGEDLWKTLQRNDRAFPVDKVLEWADQLLDALNYLHNQEPPIIHRDIKPQNLKLSNTGQIILLDFGLAKGFAGQISHVTTSGSIFGYTPNYAPLEQIQGTGTDPRSDLYSLAATLYHLMTGIMPSDVLTRLTSTTDGQPDPLRSAHEVNPQVSADVAAVLNRAMAIGRNQRPVSAAGMRKALLIARQLPQTVMSPTMKVDAYRLPVSSETQHVTPPLAQATRFPAPHGQTPPQDIVSQPAQLRRGWIWVGLVAIVFVVIVGLAIATNLGVWSSKENTAVNHSEINRGATTSKPEATRGTSGRSAIPSLNSYQVDTVTLDFNGNTISRRKEQARYFTEDLSGGVVLEMTEIAGGAFLMGSPPSEARREGDEGPQHQVTVPTFYMGKYEVTQAQWQAVMGNSPSNSKGNNLPVENVTWSDAVEFCKRLSQNTGREYRLPSEAEWEYACRAGTTTPFAFGETITADLVNYNGNPYGGAPKDKSRGRTIPVGSLGVANRFGLYDMHGNVWEWCQDIYHVNYDGAPTDGSAWESGGDARRILRGGAWLDPAYGSRSADRYMEAPNNHHNYLGFRVVMVTRS